MATHSSILARKIPWTEEPAGLQSMGSERVRNDWATEHSTQHDTQTKKIITEASQMLIQLPFCTLSNGQLPYVNLMKTYHFKKSLVLPGEQIWGPCWIILGIKIGWNFAVYNIEISCQIRYTPPIKKIQCTGQHNMFILPVWHFRKFF